MRFADIQGQQHALAMLRQAMRSQRIPSAFLFLGQHHVGKRSTALALAAALNCPQAVEEDACGHCPTCRKIAEDVHPDVVTVRADGQFIRINQVRGIESLLALNPVEARRRVVIVAQAERMNMESANAFLKTLEEPPADTLIVLCAQQARLLPETIISRCVPLRFAPLTAEVLAPLLQHSAALPPPVLDFAVRYAQGSLRPELAARAETWMALREELLALLAELPRAPLSLWSERAAKWSTGADWAFVVEWLETWCRDLALLEAGGDAALLVNVSAEKPLRAALAQAQPQGATRCHQALMEMRSALKLNVNKVLAMEALWLKFKKALHPSRRAA